MSSNERKRQIKRIIYRVTKRVSVPLPVILSELVKEVCSFDWSKGEKKKINNIMRVHYGIEKVLK